jgi:hypothetical protein
MLWISIAIVLIMLSFVLRYLGARTLIALCGEHWEILFEPLPGDSQPVRMDPPLFPGLTPADFDALIIRDSSVLRHLPPKIMKAGMRRIGLRNWGKASFWMGTALVLVGLLR